MLVTLPAVAENCEPIRNCDATRDCSLKVDTQDCEPHWGCDFPWYLAWKKAGCEIDKGRYKATCEAAKATNNVANGAAKLVCETQKSAEKLDCERVKTQMRAACEVGLDGPWRCSAEEVMLQTRTAPQEGLTDFDELSGYVTTPLKKLGGQLSWRDTACVGVGTGIPYRNSQRSTDEFCTIDVQLVAFEIDGLKKPAGNRFLRLEVLPGGRASKLCAAQTISTLDQIHFSGPIRRDRHLGEKAWLEVHVTDDLTILPKDVLSEAPLVRPVSTEVTYVVRRGDSLSKIAQQAYGTQLWPRIYKANRVRIRRPDLIFTNQVIVLPP